jgi:hypothetical protein
LCVKVEKKWIFILTKELNITIKKYYDGEGE